MRPVAPAGPFAQAAGAYYRAGWKPIPLPPKKKSPPPVGFTGGSGVDPTAEQVEEWRATVGDGNIGLRLPDYVLGIDVDAYGEKAGEQTLAAYEVKLGALPATWMTSSREDGVSGIRLFRVPARLKFPGQLKGGGVELIRWYHRYIVVAPSVHPDTGREYDWWNGGELQADEFPEPGELAELPEAWVEELTGGDRSEYVAAGQIEMEPDEVKEWLESRGDTELCTHMARTLSNRLNTIRVAGVDGGAHDATRDAAWALIGDAAGGHTGLRKALTRLKAAFTEAVGARRNAHERVSEWSRILHGGVEKVAAEGAPEEDDPCAINETAQPARESRRTGSADLDYTRDDTGNARRFARRYGQVVRYVEALGGWHIWDRNVWRLDVSGEITRMAMETITAMRDEAQFIEDAKEKAAFLKFVRASHNIGKLKAMLDLARDLKGMTVAGSRFNSDERILVLENGTVELLATGWRVRASRQEDYNTITAGTEYVDGAESEDWEKFLERFLPDVEIRQWLQRLAGYSLLGTNPQRLMVVCLGPTSTGKTTFATTIAAALGEYAGTTAMSVFRDSQDERPRADLVRILPKRFVYAEETSNAWHLHPDQIKRITGGAPITARSPYARTHLEAVPAFTPWLFANQAPTIEGADTALWRRIVVVPFNTQIPEAEEDPFFDARLRSPAGRSAVLRWLLDGYAAWATRGEGEELVPAGAVEAAVEFRTQVSSVDQFLAEACDFGEPRDYFLKPSVLYQAYLLWCGENHVRERDQLSLIALGKHLEGAGYKRSSTKHYPGSEGKAIPVRVGLRLKRGWAKAVGLTS